MEQLHVRPLLPETVDLGGSAGQIFDRQAQVRWTQAIAGGGWFRGGQWSVALENPESVVVVPGGASFRADDDHVPDLTGQLLLETGKGKVAVAALLRQIRADSRTPNVVDQSFGSAISVAGVFSTIGKDDVRFAATAGNGIGRYANGFFADGVVASDGALRLPRQWVWHAAYRHYWAATLRSSLVLSAAHASNPAETPGNTNKGTSSVHANVIWTPVANTDLGIEYIRATRKTEDGQSGRLNRLQLAAKYAF